MAGLAIVGGTVWDGTGAPARTGTVLIDSDRILEVGGELSVPAGIEQIDATGKTVIPGLIDMHVHVQLCGDDSLYAFLATGVTSVRDLGSEVTSHLALREQLASGARVGPRLFVYGPLLDGQPSIFKQPMPLVWTSADIAEGRAAVDELIASGVDGIKLYAGLRPDMLEAMVEAVGGRVPVTGHLGRTWASEAVRAGINGLEHLHASIYQDVVKPEDRHGREDGNGTNPNYWPWLCLGWSRADLDAPYVAEFIELLVERRVALSPTTVLITGGWATNEASEEPGQIYRPRFMTERMQQTREAAAEAARRGQAAPPLEIDQETGRRARANQLEFLRRLHEAGGIIVPSTDVGAAPIQVPGFSLHRELALLVEAGIPAPEVLRAATGTAAEILGRADELGTIEPGKLADLVILEGNPLADISAARNVDRVISRGEVHDPATILQRIETAAGAVSS